MAKTPLKAAQAPLAMATPIQRGIDLSADMVARVAEIWAEDLPLLGFTLGGAVRCERCAMRGMIGAPVVRCAPWPDLATCCAWLICVAAQSYRLTRGDFRLHCLLFSHFQLILVSLRVVVTHFQLRKMTDYSLMCIAFLHRFTAAPVRKPNIVPLVQHSVTNHSLN